MLTNLASDRLFRDTIRCKNTHGQHCSSSNNRKTASQTSNKIGMTQ